MKPNDDQYRDFICSYHFEGHEYGVTIKAKDLDEARRRLSCIGLGRVDGEIKATVRVPAWDWMKGVFR